MNHTKIEWVRNPDGTPGWTWNPLTGCLNHVNGMCKGGNFPCYARRLANTRLRERYLANDNIANPVREGRYDDIEEEAERVLEDPFYPRFWPERLEQPYKYEIPHGIFVCDMSDLFGVGVPAHWTQQVMQIIKTCHWHRFYLLTKQPQNLIKFSPFPDNCWVGATATGTKMYWEALAELQYIKASVKYLSLEPLLQGIKPLLSSLEYSLKKAGISWLILGSQTKPTMYPRVEWVREIVEAADKAGAPVFLKDNLNPMFADNDCKYFTEYRDKFFTFKDFEIGGTRWHLRQEMPE